jgi:raffinose/stachyose/melibiose transport system permease protein
VSRARYRRRTLLRELGLVVVALVFCSPFYVLVTIALETTPQAFKAPLSFPRPLHLNNFTDAWSSGGQEGLARGLESSVIITVASVCALIVLGSFGAYAIARRRSRLSDALYVLFVIGIILPPQLAIIPLFVAMRHLALIGNYGGMIVLNVGLLMPLTVFLYTGFIRALPRDYEEAARVDGAGVLRTYARVVFPLLGPITGTVATLIGIVIWNEFFVALVFLAGSNIQTLPVAVFSFAGSNVLRWNLIFAGVVIAIAPAIAFYLVAQRRLIRGFTSGVKG